MHNKPKHLSGLLLFLGFIAAASVAIGAPLVFAALTFNNTTITGSGGISIDATGTISIGTSSASTIIIGNTSSTVAIPSAVTITGTTTTVQNLVVNGNCTGSGCGGSGVSAINGLTNATTSIVAGSNVTVSTSSPNTITISATGSGGGTTLPALVAQATPDSTTFLQALNNAKNQVVHITLFADSFGICDHTLCGASGGPTVSTNRWIEQIRIQLQNIYGSNGTGIVPLVPYFTSTPTVNNEAYTCTGTYDTNSSALGPTQSDGNSLVHLTNGASCTFSDNRSIPYTNWSLYYATPSTSSSLAIVADGSTSLGTATAGSASASGVTNGGLTARRYDGSATLSNTTHSITFTCTGNCYVYGTAGVNGSTGISVDNVSLGGLEINALGNSSANQLAFTDLIPGGSQAVLLQDLTNDAAAGTNTGTFQTDIQNVINHEQGLSSAPTFMIVISPVDVVNGTDPEAPYTTVMTNLCTSDSLTCVNIQSRGTTVGSTAVGWGTTYNASNGLFDLTGTAWPTGSSGVHPNDKGNLDEAQMIYAALVNPVSASTGGNSSSSCLSTCTFTGATTLSSSGGSTIPLNITTDDATPIAMNSSNSAGSLILFEGSSTANVDEWGMGSAGNASISGGKTFLLGDFSTGVYALGITAAGDGSGHSEYPSLNVLCWSSLASITSTGCDSGLSRITTDSIALGNGTQGNTSGWLTLGNLSVTGTPSSTVIIGTGQSDPGCIEMYDSTNGTKFYTYIASGILITTSTKPAFCQ